MANEGNDTILRVSKTSPPADLAAAISHALYDGKSLVLRCIGAGAVNQAVKGIAIAGTFVAQRGLNIMCKPGFATVKMGDGAEVSAIVIRVFTV